MRISIRRAVPIVTAAGIALAFGANAQAGQSTNAQQCKKALTGKIADDDFAAWTTTDTRVEFYDRVERPAADVIAVGVRVSIRQEPVPGVSYWRHYADLGYCRGKGRSIVDQIGSMPGADSAGRQG